MDRYTIMVVGDERSPVRRFQLPKAYVKRAIVTAVGLVLVLGVGTWDYLRMRTDNGELHQLRIVASEQARQIQRFETTLTSVKNELGKVRNLERKVRIIANLPGAAGVGGDLVTDLVPAGQPVGQAKPELPAGVPVELEEPAGPAGGDDEDGQGADRPTGPTSAAALRVRELDRSAQALTHRAAMHALSLDELVEQLEEKRTYLLSTPSVWPTRGWLTSRFGPRISPFTGKRQRHSGIDIAASSGTPVTAPARGRVASVGTRGPLGNSLVVDHGFGIKTLYGHTKEIFVKVGDEIERGQKIASVGSTGRSTGPHLHYGVQIEGKAQDPLNYIFD